MTALNTADNIYFGATRADKVYVGTNRVWLYTPPILKTAVVWIDATQDTARADGSAISSYTSHSTSAKALAAVATREPIFRANVGGKPRIAFTADVLRLASYQVPAPGMTFVMVSRKTATPSPYGEMIAYSGAEMRTQGGVFTEATGGGAFARSTVSETNNIDYLHYVEWNNDVTHLIRIWINGLLTATSAVMAAMTRPVANLNFGGRDAADLWGDYLVSEAVVFDGYLSDADRIAVTAYLLAKWSITPMLLEKENS